MSAPLVLVIQNADDDPVGRLGEWLTDAGLTLEVVAGPDLPADLSGYAAVIVLGGAMGANDDAVAPWLPHERALLRAAVTQEIPTLAICLGAQLLAVAHGGRVKPSPEGPEIGAQLVAKRGAAATDPLFATLPITPDVLQWHFDAMTTLPAGAIQLASSPVCDNQAFRLGRLAWGLQFHIETTPELVARWAADDAATLPDLDLELVLARSDAAHPDIAETWSAFARDFAGIVRDPDSVPPPRGGPSSTADPITDPAAIRAALAAEASAARAPLPMPTRRPPWDDPSG